MVKVMVKKTKRTPKMRIKDRVVAKETEKVRITIMLLFKRLMLLIMARRLQVV